MGLNLKAGGEFTPHIRFMASTSSWKMSSDSGMVDFQFDALVFDLENIRTGWCCIAEAQAPQWVLDPSLSQIADKPADGQEWKRGFKVDVFSKNTFGDVSPVREFATSGTGANMGIDKLYDQFESEKGANPGKVPVVSFEGAVPTKVGKGNTNVPTLVIKKWVDRPSELVGSSSPASVTPAPAPVPVAAAAGGASEF